MRVCEWKTCDREVIGRIDKRFCGKTCSRKGGVDRWRRNLKTKCVDFLGGECKRCGWKEHQAGLHIHHHDPSVKEFAISNSGETRSWARVKNEIEKCVLLCSNCHAVVHVTKDPEWVKA